jgi:L-2-hydroxyglutarate oxidase LhgO
LDRIDTLVIGAGAVGLAIARALALDGREVVVLDAADAIGTGISSRNSEVIHAGIYYPRDSLKAQLCVSGREQLYAYCASRGVPHRRCGKLIVATDVSQNAELERIAAAAAANGVTDLRAISAAQARRLEPELRCTAALVSPSTGIIDAHQYMLALLGDAEAAGAVLALRARLERLTVSAGGYAALLAGDDGPALAARWVVNSAGLDAPGVAARIEGFPPGAIPRPYYAKGSYFSLAGRSPFSRLVYPVPEPGGLGTHLTLDLAGRARFGPDVEWVEAPEYSVDARRAERFYAAVRRYWPGLRDGALLPAYAGIRPKISGPNEPAADFRIDGRAQHGIAGVVNLFGIESPGLTASLAIAQHVCALLRES